MTIASSPLHLVLLLLLGAVTAHTDINIYMPSSLYHPGGYPHSTGHFGHSGIAMTHLAGNQNYGSMSLNLYNASTTLCHYYHYNTTANTTIPIHYPHYQSPFLLLASRDDNCTFVTQTRHAQHLGAAGLLIGDTHCVKGDDDCSGDETLQDRAPVVADDGSGGDISIPAILLRKQHAEAIQTTLQNQTVLVTLKWEPTQHNTTKPAPGDRQVDYGMVLDLMDSHTKSLTSAMAPIAMAVGKETRFWPMYLLYSGTEHCKRDVCTGTCTNEGRYCYPHIKGAEVIHEILRRLCIWSDHGMDDKKTGLEGEAYWNYIQYFDDNCADNYFKLDPDKDQNEKCIHKALKKARVDPDDVEVCFRDSGHPDSDAINTKLEGNLEALQEYGVTTAPHIWVERTTIPNYWMSPSPTALLRSICHGFQTQGAPKACSHCLKNEKKVNDKDITKCAKQFYHDNFKHPHRHIWRTLFLFVLIVAAGGIGYIVYRRRQDGVNLTSDGLFNPLQGYLPLNGGAGVNGSHDQGDLNGIIPDQQSSIDFQ